VSLSTPIGKDVKDPVPHSLLFIVSNINVLEKREKSRLRRKKKRDIIYVRE